MSANFKLYKTFAISIFCLGMFGCSTTDKTHGTGMVSTVAQNVIRVSASSAINSMDFGSVKGQKVFLRYSGFQEELTRGFINFTITEALEAASARVVNDITSSDFIIDVVVNVAGNDRGGSWALISTSERTEGTVDLTFNIRNTKDGTRIISRNVRGEAKYEQSKYVGVITPEGSYYVRRNQIFERIPGVADADCKKNVFSQLLFSGCK